MNRIWQHSGCQWKMQWNTSDLSELEPMFITCWQIRSTVPVLELYNFCHHRLRHLSIFPVHLLSGTNASQLSCLSSSCRADSSASWKALSAPWTNINNTISVMLLYHHLQVRSYQMTFSFTFFKRTCSQFCIRFVHIGADRSTPQKLCTRFREFAKIDRLPRLSARMEQIDLAGYSWNFVL